MPPVSCPSPILRASRWKSNVEMIKEDDHCVLNVSPRPSRHENHPGVHMETKSFHKSSNSWNAEKDYCFRSIQCLLSDGKTTSKSSEELLTEIAMLEVEIVHLEQYLLSLYRTAFERHLPRMGNPGIDGQQITGSPSLEFVSSDQLSHTMKLRIPKAYNDHHDQSSPTSALAGPNDLIQVMTTKSSFGTFQDKTKAYSRHRSLGDHLGNSGTLDALVCPDRLSEEIVRCISSIYCKLANPPSTLKGYSASSTSSFSSSTFSPRNLSGSWSPQCNDETTEHCDFEALKQENGPYAAMIEVLKICLDNESYSYAAKMLQKFRSLVKSLEDVDPNKMRREEKLAFWINIHNALVMHAYLAYGTQNYIKSTSIVKAAYNVGGHCINAYDIQSSILGIKSHYSAPWLQTFLSPGKKFRSGSSRHTYAIEYPEPLVHFALSSGAYSDPAVRLYKADTIFEDLKVAKEEFIQATVYVHKETKIYLPKILCYYGKDMSLDIAALLEAVGECLFGIQRKAVEKCVKGRPEKHVYWLEQTSAFRYLIDKELAA